MEVRMSNDEKLSLIKLLTEINGLMIINKLEMKDNSTLLVKAKKVAKKLQEENIGTFNFTTDETFEKSINDFDGSRYGGDNAVVYERKWWG
jgi:hypothetical protein